MERLYLPTSRGEISYLERDGEFPVIFLHGLGGSGNNWLKLAQYLPEKYRILMPDLGGHGRTTAKMIQYSIAEQVDLLREFLEGKGISRYAMVGNSYGGWVSMRFSSSVEKPAFLVLLDSAGINPTVGESSSDAIDRFVERVVSMNPKNDPDVVRRFVIENASGKEKVSSDELSGMPENTMIVWGSGDRLIPLKYAETLHSGIAGSRLEILEGAGHTPHSTHPEEVARLLKDFVNA